MKNQKGFGAIEALLILVIVGIIGGVGYYVYNANKQELKISDSSIKHAENKQINEEKDNQGEYIELKDLGIKIKSNNVLKELTFEADPEVPETYYVHHPEVDRLIYNCMPDENVRSADAASFEAISRGEGQHPGNNKGPAYGELLKQFDDFYISAGYPNGVQCDRGTTEDQAHELWPDLRDSLNSAIEKAELL